MLALTVLRLAWFKTGLNFMTLYPRVAEVVRLSADAKMAKNLRQARICYICDKYVVFARNCKFADSNQYNMRYIICHVILHFLAEKHCF